MDAKNLREKYALRGSIAGISANFGLFAIKFLVGTLSGSVAVTADSFNNLSDIGSSAVTLIGFKMAEKPSDKEHPFGHGRIEYISGLMVSFIILMLGVELIKSAVEKILHPAPTAFSPLLLILLCATIPVKLWLSVLNRRYGKEINSPAMLATARDSLNDAIVTSATIVSAALTFFTDWKIDGYIGLCVAAFVLCAGIGILRDTLGPLLGQPPSAETVQEIEERILRCDGIHGIHDVIVHNYGPDRYIASAHAEVRADSDILKIHDVIDLAEREIAEEMGIIMTIHLDPIDTDDVLTNKLKDVTKRVVASIDPALTLHDFRIVSGDTHTNLIFDLVVPRTLKMTNAALKEEIDNRLRAVNPNYFTVIVFDHGFI